MLTSNKPYKPFFQKQKNLNVNFPELYSQPDKIAVVTGGSRGLGLYVVKKLVDCDMTVIVGEFFFSIK